MYSTRRITMLAILASALLGLQPAVAGPIDIGKTYTFDLVQADPAAGLGDSNGVGNFGTVTLTQALNEVDVSVALKAGYLFANTGNDKGPHQAFVFNLGSGFAGATLAMTSLSNLFDISNKGPFNQTPWGDFTDAVEFNASVKGGLSAKIAGPVTFSVKAAGITLDNFVSNAPAATLGNPQPIGYLFSADVGNAASGKTGNVVTAANTAPQVGHVVAEPNIIALLGLGLLGAGLTMRRRK